MSEKDEMFTEILARIDVLASKLGVAAEHLWEIMVRQATIEGVIELLVLGVLFMALVVFFRIFFEKKLFDYVEDAPTPAGIAVVVSLFIAAVMIIVVAVSFCSLADIVTKIFNPEYWAYQSLLGDVK